jgi:hypothetical protein
MPRNHASLKILAIYQLNYYLIIIFTFRNFQFNFFFHKHEDLAIVRLARLLANSFKW